MTKLIDRLLELTSTPVVDSNPDFNILRDARANGKLDENAHTRILVRLLRCDSIRRQFLEMIRQEGASTKQLLSDENIAQVGPWNVKAFSQYIDALIVLPKQFAIIIENKVELAQDQKTQIERYVSVVKDEYGLSLEKIIVVYLTRMAGGAPSADSLGEVTKNRLACFLSLSYRKNVLPWLIKLSVPASESDGKQVMIGAINLYVEYLKSMFADDPNDPYMKIVQEVRKELSGETRANPYLILGQVTAEILLKRQYVAHSPSKEIADERFYKVYPKDKGSLLNVVREEQKRTLKELSITALVKWLLKKIITGGLSIRILH